MLSVFSPHGRYLSRYLGIGVINTIIGHGTIFSLMFMGLNPFVSNAVGYVIGITVSYLLNKTFNFKSYLPHKKAYPRFVASLLVAYGVNVAILALCLHIFALNKYLAQVVAGVFYTGIGYLGSRYVAFPDVRS